MICDLMFVLSAVLRHFFPAPTELMRCRGVVELLSGVGRCLALFFFVVMHVCPIGKKSPSLHQVSKKHGLLSFHSLPIPIPIPLPPPLSLPVSLFLSLYPYISYLSLIPIPTSPFPACDIRRTPPRPRPRPCCRGYHMCKRWRRRLRSTSGGWRIWRSFGSR